VARFPVLKLRGGPHPNNITLELDGKEIESSTDMKLSLSMGVNDVVRATWTQFITPDVEMELGQQLFRVKVRDEDFGWIEAKADTVWQALYDCARQLELAARKDGQGVAQAGTIVEPEGRPPGR
jgi:hypothetical protein